MIRAVLVDDETLARDALRVRLAAETDVIVVGEAADGPDAVEQIVTLLPDLVFLDVQMPEMNGFEVLARVAATHLPVIVFVSAHDRFAVAAFEAHALDYLLKPFSLERFQEALRRARVELARGEERPSPERMAALLDGLDPVRAPVPAPYPSRFVVKEHARIVLVATRDIDRIEAAGNYVELHVGAHRHLLRETMKALETRLDPERFARIHRSTIVNVDRVREIRPGPQGDFDVVLEGGTRVRMSRHFRGRLLSP